VAERDGVVTIACRSATWAQELDLLQPELVKRLNGALSEADPDAIDALVKGLRFTADAPRHLD
jgi:predicted nucleic acid-binding Zn ribbon protein